MKFFAGKRLQGLGQDCGEFHNYLNRMDILGLSFDPYEP